jgi:hypothetical protein
MTALSTSEGQPDELCWVSTRVHACVSGFELVYVRTADELQFVLTPDTEGVHMEDLREGQSVECLVSTRLPRVVCAKLKT